MSILADDADLARQPYQQTTSYDGDEGAEGDFCRRNIMPPSGGAGSKMTSGHFLGTKWPRLFFLVVTIQAIICITLEAFVFGRFQTSLNSNLDDDTDLQAQVKSIPTFLTLVIFGFLYELLLTGDALRLKNTIQVIGLSVANVALLIYTILQYDQINNAISFLSGNHALKQTSDDQAVWPACRPFLVTIPIIIAVGSLSMAFMSWKLYQEFAWDILKQIGADYRMKKRFLHYQIYIALLKFDFFFFLGFTVQFLVIVNGKTGAEFALTTAAIPVTIIILLAAVFCVQHENRAGMISIIVLYFGGLAYFFFKLVRIYQPTYSNNYSAVRKSLTAFAVLTILLIVLTIANAFVCTGNFGAGLKTHLVRSPSRQDPEKLDPNSFQLQEQKPTAPTRMTID